MGTTYQVKYVAETDPAEIKRDVDALLADINQSMSNYIATSIISGINDSKNLDEWHPIDKHFETVFRRSYAIYKDTNGKFNPAVGPLVDAWGFGREVPERLPDDSTVRALLEVTKVEAFELRPSPPAIRKHIAGAKLDFGAIAKGYGADAVGELLEQRGMKDYLVEIAGEIRARGHLWHVGVEKPSENAFAEPALQHVFGLSDAGLSTSGTYRNYEVQDGKRVTHILNPQTGYPAENSLLSVSVLARDTMTADAYATALLVMGLDDGMQFVESHKQLEAYFIAKDAAGNLVERRSDGFPNIITGQ
jgi:thiamine biosynthesis lipoprotein